MKYRVILEHGASSGPFTVDELRALQAEGRIQAGTIVEDETGARFSADRALSSQGSANVEAGLPDVLGQSPVRPLVPVVVAFGTVCLGLVLFASVLLPVISQGRMRAMQQRTVLNARQLGIAVMLYAADNDDRLPLDMSNAIAARPSLQRYVTDDRAFSTFNPTGGEFLGNPKVSGTSIREHRLPAQIVVFYESVAWPDRRRVVLWLDGHVTRSADFDAARTLGN